MTFLKLQKGTNMANDDMMRETKRKSDILSRWRKEFNCFAISMVGNKMQQPGLPDALVLYKDVHIWIEFKNPETETRTIQTIIHRRFLEHGVKVWIVRFLTETEWVIENSIPALPIKFDKVGIGAKKLFYSLIQLESTRLQERRQSNLPMELKPVIGEAGQ